ncbi:MAG: dephospho-CoA kinase [Chloroflexi bacterium]|nr:dephospho-CoA kinase [Chloroflexota bacterium]
MIVVGLTGGIASGKSTVSQTLAELGAAIINADETGHELLKPNTEAWREIVAAFGEGVIGESGEIDRAKLGEIIFRSPEARQRLNAITHPRIYAMVQHKIDEARRRGALVAVVEAALFIEAGWFPLVDQLWVTVVPEDVMIQRLRNRNGVTQEQARARISSQLSSEERIKHADVVISTDCSLDEVREKVKQLWGKHLAGQ